MADAKGGPWKNSEDEILKAAVMKYGMNHWSRISSLLARRTPDQCKARWFDWLDPTIRKTEWSLEEDRKLLTVAKLFPSQWRTIAAQVGRTAHQCVSRFEFLLQKSSGRSADISLDRPSSFLDENPEAQPAELDSVNMDSGELDMLNEARARLANIRGKKAARKEREKEAEESKLLSRMARDRELSAAGLSSANGALSGFKRDQINYLTDIPFERAPHGSTSEDAASVEDKLVSLEEVARIRAESANARGFMKLAKDANAMAPVRAASRPEAVHYTSLDMSSSGSSPGTQLDPREAAAKLRAMTEGEQVFAEYSSQIAQPEEQSFYERESDEFNTKHIGSAPQDDLELDILALLPDAENDVELEPVAKRIAFARDSDPQNREGNYEERILDVKSGLSSLPADVATLRECIRNHLSGLQPNPVMDSVRSSQTTSLIPLDPEDSQLVTMANAILNSADPLQNKLPSEELYMVTPPSEVYLKRLDVLMQQAEGRGKKEAAATSDSMLAEHAKVLSSRIREARSVNTKLGAALLPFYRSSLNTR